jgi:hypothetical protein
LFGSFGSAECFDSKDSTKSPSKASDIASIVIDQDIWDNILNVDSIAYPRSTPKSDGWSVSFWMMIVRPVVGAFRTIISRHFCATIMIWPQSHRLLVQIGAIDANDDAHDSVFSLDSTSLIPLAHWTHVALIVHDNLVQLWINGIRDSVGVIVYLIFGIWCS